MVFLGLSLLSPSEPDRAIALGLSSSRLMLSLALLAASLLAGGFTSIVLRSADAHSDIERHIRNHRSTYLGLAAAAFVMGVAILTVHVLGAGGVLSAAIVRFLPGAGWLSVSGASAAILLSTVDAASKRELRLALAAGAVIVVLGAAIHVRAWPARESTTNDIYYTYLEGQRLLRFEDPYARVLEGDSRENAKYATYLPLFYALAAGVQTLGLADYAAWIVVWRIAFLFAALGAGLGLFAYLNRAGMPVLGMLASAFWLWNRWTLHVVQTADMDFLPIGLLVWAALWLGSRPSRTLWLFGVATALKHYALFLAPVFLLEAWRSRPRSDGMGVLRDIGRVAAIPLLVSLPFLVTNAPGFLRSVLFSVTRDPVAIGEVDSLDAVLGWTGPLARLPMVTMVLLVYAVYWRKQIGPLAAGLLILVVVTYFNPVFFTSYMVWTIPWIALAVAEGVVGAGISNASPR